jgi:hypothetical protein
VKHFAHIHNASEEGVEVFFGHHFKIARQLSVTLQLGYGRKGVLEKARKFMRARVRATLDDVGRHGHRRSRELVAKGGTSDSAHSGRDSMCLYRELASGLPYAKISKIAHISSSTADGLALTSFACSEARDSASDCGKLPAGNGSLAAYDGQRATGNWPRPAGIGRRATGDGRRATGNGQRAAGDAQFRSSESSRV